jgi:hypothetical protein
MTSPANFGSDLSGSFDPDPMGQQVTGRLLLSQALVRRITTPRGRLLDDPSYGYDVSGELGDDVAPNVAGRIAANIDAEFTKDERVVSSSTVATFNSGVLDTTTTVTDGAGPFKLVLAISGVTVAILQMGTGP